jgi:hypothetical protein
VGTTEARTHQSSTVRKRRLYWLEQSCFEGIVSSTKGRRKNRSTPEGILASYARSTGAPADVVHIPNPDAPEREMVIGRVFHQDDGYDLYILFVTDPRTRQFLDIGRVVKR